jgi:hypothetical protein
MSTINQKPIRTKTQLKVETDTPAKVIERKDGKTITYEATVSETEVTDNESENFDIDEESETFEDGSATGLPFIEEQNTQEIRKTKLEIMFSLVRSAVKDDKQDDSFFAFVVRLPDNINSQYNYPCNRETELGVFQFTSRDMFAFPTEIQKRNNNSGGMFNVSVYRADQQPLILYRRTLNRMYTQEIVVGMTNYSISNPVTQPDFQKQNGFSGNGVENQIMALIEKQDERFNRYLEQQNAPKEKSLLERAMEEKMLRDIVNPPPPPSNGMESMMPMMMQWLSAPAMIARMTETAFPTPTPPEQKDWIDKTSQIFEMPAVQQLLGKVGDISEAIAVSRLPQMQNPATETEYEETDDKDDMQILLETVIAELESDNPLDHTNAVVSDLKNDFPDHFDTLQTACQTFDFDGVFALLINKSSKMQPSPFVPFLDIEQTQTTKKHVWNERGNKLIERLKEFYEYVKIAE